MEALTTTGSGVEESADFAWGPQLGPQSDACSTAGFVDELFYGGAAGGGKTDFLLGDFLEGLWQAEEWQGILFRRTFPELDEVVDRSLQIYPYTGGSYLVGQHLWRWPNGANLRLRHLDEEEDFTRYLGMSYSWIGWDELPTWATLGPYKKMKSRLRGAAVHKRIRATGNPGGRCHREIKEYFGIDTHRAGYQLLTDPETAMTRMFVPSRVRDNLILLERDPGYVSRLKGVGDPELVAAWLEGDWDAVVGSYFSMFSRSKCEVEPFKIPDGWALFTCLDYGETNPCWAGLLAVNFDDDVYVIDEYHKAGASGADHAKAVKRMIEKCPFTSGRRPRMNLAPHDMWTKRKPGEASQALSPSDSFAKAGVWLTRANMERVNGWRNLKDLLYSDRLRFFRSRTEHVCSSLSSVQRDPHDPEDVLKGGADHPADGLRYGINHVYRARKRQPKKHLGPNSGQHLMDLIANSGKQVGRYS